MSTSMAKTASGGNTETEFQGEAGCAQEVSPNPKQPAADLTADSQRLLMLFVQLPGAERWRDLACQAQDSVEIRELRFAAEGAFQLRCGVLDTLFAEVFRGKVENLAACPEVLTLLKALGFSDKGIEEIGTPKSNSNQVESSAGGSKEREKVPAYERGSDFERFFTLVQGGSPPASALFIARQGHEGASVNPDLVRESLASLEHLAHSKAVVTP